MVSAGMMKMSGWKGLKYSRCALFLAVLSTFFLNISVAETNHKDELVLRPAMISSKVTQSLLLDLAVQGESLAAVGERGHVILSKDNGRSWMQSPTPVTIMLTGVAMPDQNNLFVVGHEGLIMHSGDAGKTWEVQYGNPYVPAKEGAEDDAFGGGDPRAGAPLLDVWFKDANHGFALGAYGALLHTQDGGKSWEDWSDRMDNEDQWHLNALATEDKELLYIVGEKGMIFRSLDGGESWQTLESPYDGSLFGVLVGPGRDEVMVFGLQGKIYRSTNRGDSWVQVNSPTDNSLMGGTFLDGRNVVLVGNNGVILYSRDGGNSFDMQQMKDRLSITAIQRNAEGRLVMVGQAGVRLASPAMK
ncbi:Hypothetical protein HDN1F_10940 [gamma proteobacterium HdN1]|nr:Hypothetical protein HDN1F_10940 [gamma proteobacterium HdN1]